MYITSFTSTSPVSNTGEVLLAICNKDLVRELVMFTKILTWNIV